MTGAAPPTPGTERVGLRQVDEMAQPEPSQRAITPSAGASSPEARGGTVDALPPADGVIGLRQGRRDGASAPNVGGAFPERTTFGTKSALAGRTGLAGGPTALRRGSQFGAQFSTVQTPPVVPAPLS